MSNFWPFFLEILLFSPVLFALFAGALGLLGGLNLLNLLLAIVLLVAVMGPSCRSCPSLHPSWLWCWFWSPPACTVDLTSSELLIVQKGLPDWVTVCLCHVQGSLSLWKWNMLEKWQFPFFKANYSYLKWGWRWPEWVSLMPAVGWGRWGTGYGGSWLSLHEAQLLRQPLVPRPSSWGRGTYFRAAGMVKVLRITGFRIGHLLVAGASRSDPRHTLWHWFTNLLNLALSSVIDVLGR